MNTSISAIKRIAVFCGSSTGNDQTITKAAHELGKTLAMQKIELIYGGSQLGVMGEVANGCLEQQGKVIGVILEFLKTKEIVHPNLTELITTKDMHERKLTMNRLSHGFIMLPGGFGTFEEFFEILTWGQLGLHEKPIGMLNVNGFFDNLLAMMEKMVETRFLKASHIGLVLNATTIEELILKMHAFKPLPKPKWITESQT